MYKSYIKNHYCPVKIYFNEYFINVYGINRVVYVYGGCFPPSGKCVKKIIEWNVKKPALFEPTIGGEFAGFSGMK